MEIFSVDIQERQKEICFSDSNGPFYGIYLFNEKFEKRVIKIISINLIESIFFRYNFEKLFS